MAHLKHYYADIVLNQNLYAEQLHYIGEPYTRWLLGTHYVLLRREFLARQNWKREIPEVARHVLVTLGGGDPENATLGVIQALQEIDVPGLEAIVVIGPNNPHAAVLETAIEPSRIPIRLVRDARNMPELMAWADAAISAGGSTVWELAFMCLPTALLVLSDNQRPIVQSLGDAGATLNLGWYSETTPDGISKALMPFLMRKKARTKMAQLSRQLVDGNGTKRVVSVMLAKDGDENADSVSGKQLGRLAGT
jgi:spore coat polysaccharide biosynthesis predicted glycosyltransferase SpsG